MRNDPASFGAVLRRLRADAALSQEELAERAGLSARGISDLERGARTAPHLHTVRLLADALNVSESDRADLLTAARPPPPQGRGTPGDARPPLRLPHPLTRLIGREAQLATLLALLRRDDVRLVTLTGSGGIGKTRFALEAAKSVAGDFADGVVFVDLAPLRDPANVLAAIAAALEIRDSGPLPLLEMVRAALARRELLLLLDNFEHLLPAAPLVTDLLQTAAGVNALVTSRQALRLRGEREFALPSLALPASSAARSAELVIQSEAVTLFVERTQDVRFDYALTDDDAPAVAEIVARLDGLPLAIELVAAWTRSLPPAALAARLEQRLPLLSLGVRDASPRHQTMRHAIAWSHDLLSPPGQALFRRVSVFVGGFSPDVAPAITGSSSDVETREQLARLVEHSLIVAQVTAAGTPRYSLLETIREFAHERLAESGEETRTRELHAAAYRDLAERARLCLHGPQQTEWLHQLETDHDNLRAALAWTIDMHRPVDATRLAASLWLFWTKRSHWTEGRVWLRRVLSLPEAEVPAAVRAEALFGAGILAGMQSDFGEAAAFLEASLMKWREAESNSGIARAIAMMGVATAYTMQFGRAVSLLREAIPLFELPKDEPWAAHATSYLGFALVGLGELDLGIAYAEEGLARQQAVGEYWGVANSFVTLADVLAAKGEHRRALALFANGLRMWASQGGGGAVLWPLLGLAKVAIASGRGFEAAVLIGYYEAITNQANAVSQAYFGGIHDRERDAAHALLGEERFAAAQAVCQLTPIDQIPQAALQLAQELANAG